MWFLLLFLISAVLPINGHPTSLSSLRQCQRVTKPSSCDWITVGQPGTRAKFHTIQSAIDSLPRNKKQYNILVLSGQYFEQLNITRPGPVWLFGQTDHPEDQTKNTVEVSWNSPLPNNGTGSFTDNAYTSVLTVAPNLNASLVGSGPTGFPVPADTPFGNTDFRVYNINFRNTAADKAIGPRHAIGISRANAGFYFSGFYSFQDTIYIGKLANAYFYGSDLAGTTDFIYGFGTAWVERSNVTLRGCGGGIIAWKGTNTTFTNKYGAYISNSAVRPENGTIAVSFNQKCALGRPWNSLHRSIYQNTYLSALVKPAGYDGWGTNYQANVTLEAEYKSFGPGNNETARSLNPVSTILDKQQVGPYDAPRDVFMSMEGKQPDYKWIDKSYLPCKE